MRKETIDYFVAQLERLVDQNRKPRPLPHISFPDKWVAASCMQKAIRRGEAAVAASACGWLFNIDRKMCRRRIAVTSLEDIGIADVELVGCAVFASLQPSLVPVAIRYAALEAVVVGMAMSPKERSGDYMQTTLELHSSAEALKQTFQEQSCDDLVSSAQDEIIDWRGRSLAATMLAGTTSLYGSSLPLVSGDQDAYCWMVERLRVPFWMPDISLVAYRGTREAMSVQYPIKVSLGRDIEVTQHTLENSAKTNGIPHYSLDMHTRLGKQAFRCLVDQSKSIRQLITSITSRTSGYKAIEWMMFYIEAVLLDREVSFVGYQDIKWQGIEADLARSGFQSIANRQLKSYLQNSHLELEKIRTNLLSDACVGSETFNA